MNVISFVDGVEVERFTRAQQRELATLILQALGYTEIAFREYPHYPNEQVRQERLATVETAKEWVRSKCP